MSLSKSIMDLTKTSGTSATGGIPNARRHMIHVAAAAVAVAATVTSGYVLFSKYRSPRSSGTRGSPDPVPKVASGGSSDPVPQVASLKDAGNRYFTSGNYREALENYTQLKFPVQQRPRLCQSCFRIELQCMRKL